ncbi:MAG: HD domain-containing phosphohydrolase [Sulfurimonas sp.]
MNKNEFAKHLSRDKEDVKKDDLVKLTKMLYSKTAESMKNVLSNITCIETLDFIDENVKEMIDFITNDCCTIESLARILEHDYYTHTHSINVAVYAIFLGQVLKLDEKELEYLGISAILHDLGKSKINLEIINKNSKLSAIEFAVIKEHPRLGFEIARSLGIKNEKVLTGIKHHHERLDGKGYPDSLIASELKLFPKIIAICDVFDALTTKRSYKEPMSSYEAFKLMKKDQYHLDGRLLKRFMQMMVSTN